jgi:Transposase zinc-binding domain
LDQAAPRQAARRAYAPSESPDCRLIALVRLSAHASFVAPDFRAPRTDALTSDQHAVLRDLERCRTAVLGGHMHVCDSCGYAVPMYNACRNRHCPTCQSLEQHKWLERRRETILPVPYFHLVFTLPSELRPITRMNPERAFHECSTLSATPSDAATSAMDLVPRCSTNLMASALNSAVYRFLFFAIPGLPTRG